MHDALIPSGAPAARERAEMWRLSEERHRENGRAELRRQWAEYFRLLERNHRQLAQDNARKALALEQPEGWCNRR